MVVRGDGCWEWSGAHADTGYAQTSLNKKVLYAHRVSWELHNGPIPAGLTIDHLCRNRGCVNPAHMEPVTMAENIRRAHVLPACKRGHRWTPETTYLRPDGRGRNCLACIRLRTRTAA